MLHHKQEIIAKINDDIFSSIDTNTKLAKYTIPEHEHNPHAIYQLIADELLLDGNSRQNLATFCQTWLEPEIQELMKLSIDKNIVDKDEYPQTAEIESRCVHILGDLWGADENMIGTSTTGSSEAAMLGGLAMLWNWRDKQKTLNKPIDKPNLITGPVQVCWHKFARYWDVELREIPMEDGRYIMNSEQVIKRCDENTIGVVPTLGVTFTGQYEPVLEVSEALDKLQQKTNLNIPIHVDAASGGFLAPFIQKELKWDFRIQRVKSINASGHKFGLSPLGVGWIIWQNKEDLPEKLIFNVNYLGGNMPDFALNFSRPGGQVVSQYYNFLRLGKEGYTKVHSTCRSIAMHIASKIEKMGHFDIIYDGSDGIPAISWKLKNNNYNFTLFDLEERLRIRGWQVAAYTLPANLEDLVIQRILIRHGFSYDMADLLLKDFQQAVKFLLSHSNPSYSSDNIGGFSHL